MDVVQSTVKWQYALMNYHDLFVFLKAPGEHIIHIAIVLWLLDDAGVTNKLQNCVFITHRTDYVDHFNRPADSKSLILAQMRDSNSNNYHSHLLLTLFRILQHIQEICPELLRYRVMCIREL